MLLPAVEAQGGSPVLSAIWYSLILAMFFRHAASFPMITVFHDAQWRNAHALFQSWRKANPSGFFINRRGGKGSQLHDAQCHHLGSADTGAYSDGEGTLTKRPKICARTVEELEEWAATESVDFRPCKHCALVRQSPEILSASDYQAIIWSLLRRAKSLVLEEEFAGVPPERVQTVVNRIVRDTMVAIRVKEMHKYRCQICGTVIHLQDHPYAEAHHIRPLGRPHEGGDEVGNVLCVCPNHHVELDYAVRPLDLATLRTVPGHRIDRKSIEHHNNRVKERLSI